MIESLLAAFRIPELKKRIIFVLMMFAIYVLGAHIPAPGVNHEAVNRFFGFQSGLLGLLNAFSGGALRRFSIFGLGVMPYINATIIMQMLTMAIPQLEEMQKEGEAGRKQIAKITRYMTIVLALIQAIGFSYSFGAVLHDNFIQMMQVWISMTAGTSLLMWIGEQITEKGVGNGISLVIFAGIMTYLPTEVGSVYISVVKQLVNPFNVILMIVIFILTILGIVFVERGQRKIPIQHAKRVVGMKVTQGGSSFLPIRVDTAGVIPIIFAISLVTFPGQIFAAIPIKSTSWFMNIKNLALQMMPGNSWWGTLVYVFLIIVFTYFYTSIIMNVHDMADNLKRYGNYIPGIRPGKPTFEYLDRVVSRITLAGAIFLAAVALMQYVAPMITGVTSFSLVGGISLLIVVAVAIETMQAIESQMLMRNYEGFIKSNNISSTNFRGY